MSRHDVTPVWAAPAYPRQVQLLEMATRAEVFDLLMRQKWLSWELLRRLEALVAVGYLERYLVAE